MRFSVTKVFVFWQSNARSAIRLFQYNVHTRVSKDDVKSIIEFCNLLALGLVELRIQQVH